MRRGGFAVIAVGCSLLVGVSAPIAHAAARLTLTLPSQATAGEATSVRFMAHGVPSTARLVLQRRVGTARVWRTVMSLGTAHEGSAQLAPLPLGVYNIRLAAIGRRHQLSAQRSAGLPVFGTVPFSTLFEGAHITSGVGIGETGTYTTRTSIFDYFIIYEYDGNLTSEANQFAFSVSHNPCRSVHLEFVGRREESRNPTLTAEVIQADADPVLSAPTAIESIGTLDASVVAGKSWGLRFEGTPLQPTRVFLNGSASCDAAHITE
jgi:hypothetical protein